MTDQNASGPIVTPRALSHIGIQVADLARSKAYYRDVLGWQEIYDNQAEPGADHVVIGIVAGLAIELTKKAAAPLSAAAPDPNAIGFVGITFSVPDVDVAYAALKAKGLANMDPPVTMPPDVRLVLFRDPDGNLLELIDLRGPKSIAEMAGLA
jgi:catechol 2,3-dioxygenase-like lactoylglutathione lyase family enzyme